MYSGQVTQEDVERIVRSVLRDFGLGLALRSVSRTSDSWAVTLSQAGHPLNCLRIPDGTPHGVRRAMMAALGLEA